MMVQLFKLFYLLQYTVESPRVLRQTDSYSRKMVEHLVAPPAQHARRTTSPVAPVPYRLVVDDTAVYCACCVLAAVPVSPPESQTSLACQRLPSPDSS